jgi:hypothetical protein
MDEKNPQDTNVDQPASPTPESLSDSQRQVLAKVYRFLLGLKHAPTKQDNGKEQSAYSEVLLAAGSLKSPER